jgi:hypothetical protein
MVFYSSHWSNLIDSGMWPSDILRVLWVVCSRFENRLTRFLPFFAVLQLDNEVRRTAPLHGATIDNFSLGGILLG